MKAGSIVRCKNCGSAFTIHDSRSYCNYCFHKFRSSITSIIFSIMIIFIEIVMDPDWWVWYLVVFTNIILQICAYFMYDGGLTQEYCGCGILGRHSDNEHEIGMLHKS